MKKFKILSATLCLSLVLHLGYANAEDPFLMHLLTKGLLTVPQHCENRNGCRVQVRENDFSPQQTWKLSDNFNTFAPIRSNTGKCLEVKTICAGQNGCPVQIWNCTGRAEQRWKLVKSKNAHLLVNGAGAANKMLQVTGCPDGNTYNCVVRVGRANSSENQLWIMGVGW